MGKELVVFVHGHMGCAQQFQAIASGLRDVDLTCVTLPGHETDIDGFVRTNGRDWQGCVDALLDRLRQEYDGIILVGHSMGGLLCINAAMTCPDRVKAIVAIAPPLRIKITYRGLKIRIKALSSPKPMEGPDISAARALSGVSGVTAGNAIRLLPNLRELFKIMRHTRRSISGLTVPLVAIHSRNDEIVSARSLGMIRQALPSAQIVELKASSHFWISEEEATRIVHVINGLLHKHGGSGGARADASHGPAPMCVRYIGRSSPLELTHGRVYEVLSVEKNWYRLVDDTNEDYLYPPELFVLE